MKRRLIILAGALVLGALVVWIWLAATSPVEPVYEGKKLSEWLKAAGSADDRQISEAVGAIRSMGSNAAPWMVFRLRREALKTYWLKRADKLFHTGTRFEQWNEPAMRTVRGVVLPRLGPSMVPELERLMEESSNDEVLYQAYFVAEIIVSVQNDSRFSTLSLSSNALAKVNAALAKRGRGPPIAVRTVTK